MVHHCKCAPCVALQAAPQLFSSHIDKAAEGVSQRYTGMQARESLQIVRGASDVEAEFNDIKQAADSAAQIRSPWRLYFSKQHLPQVVLCICSTLFQQFTGINPISI